MKYILAVLAVCSLLLTGCATFVQCNVTRFHNLPAVGEPKTFAFLPNHTQKNSIEYSSYCALITTKLETYGWKKHDTSKSDLPDYLVSFAYNINKGERITGSITTYGETGGGTSYTTGTIMGSGGGFATYSGTTYTPPTFGPVGDIPYSIDQYHRSLRMEILDAKTSTKENVIRVFEGRVLSTGTSQEIMQVLPTMIEALFQKFPGISGKTETERLN